VEIASPAGGRFALPSAVCERRLPFRHQGADRVPVELRGAGAASRQVNNFCTPEAFEADALIACEVLTPAGNWSSYPPHKHDEDRLGEESVLEEIYYFEVADGPAGPGLGYHRVYGTADRPIDVTAEVRTGDVVLVPHGWHGPSMAAPGYHLYYLNVMAGPSADRAWLICDDPAHTWVRDTWADQDPDPRLPLSSPTTTPQEGRP
jgi:5-deoxy-glucuronate isomerase